MEACDRASGGSLAGRNRRPNSGHGAGNNTVSVISDATNNVVAIIPVGGYPYGLAYDSGTNEIFVTNSESDAVSVISDNSNSVVATVPVGLKTLGAAYDPTAGEIFVSGFNPSGSCTVAVISDRSNTVVATVTVGTSPSGLAYDSAMKEVFVAMAGDNNVSIIPANGSVVAANVAVGENPRGVAFDSAKGEIFVSNYMSNTVSVISDSNNSVVATVSVGSEPQGLAYDYGSGEVFVADGGGYVSVISDSNNAVVATVPAGNSPMFAAYDSSAGEVFISNFRNSVTVISDHSASSTTLPTSPLRGPTLTLSCVSTTSYNGFKVDVNGELSANGTGISGVPISISTRLGNSWQPLTIVNTASDGSFTAEWFPSVTGNYTVVATLASDTNWLNTTVMVNFVVMPLTSENGQTVFSIASNSTVTDLTFNSTSQELSFTVSGPSGTTGYVDAFIAKSLVGDISGLKVYLDGNPLNYTATLQGDSWLIHFTYHHSTHKVVMNLGAATNPKGSSNPTNSPTLLNPVSSANSKSSSTMETIIIIGVVAVAAVTLGVVLKRRKQNL